MHAHASRDGRALVGVLDLGATQTLERTVEAGERLDVTLRGTSDGRLRVSRERSVWNLELAADLSSALHVRTAAGEVLLDLRGTAVHELEVVAEVGRHVVFLPDGDVAASVTTQVGDLLVHVPADATVRVAVSGAMSRVEVPVGFAAVPGGYLREGAGTTVDLSLHAGLGQVRVRSY